MCKNLHGPVEFRCRVYLDMAAIEKNQYVYLLDEALEIARVGLFSMDFCRQAASFIRETNHRGTARAISGMTEMSISHQPVRNMI